jgi:hypothetical protein
MTTSRSPQFSPSGLSKHLRMGSTLVPHQFLTTQMEPCGFIKSSAKNYTLHMKLSLRLSFLTHTQPRGLHGWFHYRIPSLVHRGLSPIMMPSNPTTVTMAPYEYLLCLPSSDWLRPPTRRKAQGLVSVSHIPGTMFCRLQPKHLDRTGSHWQQMDGEP